MKKKSVTLARYDYEQGKIKELKFSKKHGLIIDLKNTRRPATGEGQHGLYTILPISGEPESAFFIASERILRVTTDWGEVHEIESEPHVIEKLINELRKGGVEESQATPNQETWCRISTEAADPQETGGDCSYAQTEELISLAASMIKSANFPEYGDEWDWFKSTPLSEKGRVIQRFRDANELLYGFAVRIAEIARNKENPKRCDLSEAADHERERDLREQNAEAKNIDIPIDPKTVPHDAIDQVIKWLGTGYETTVTRRSDGAKITIRIDTEERSIKKAEELKTLREFHFANA